MPKKSIPMPHIEICRIMTQYLGALKQAKGEQVMDQTDLTYRKGFFYLRPAGLSREAPAIPYRPSEIEALTKELGGQG